MRDIGYQLQLLIPKNLASHEVSNMPRWKNLDQYIQISILVVHTVLNQIDARNILLRCERVDKPKWYQKLLGMHGVYINSSIGKVEMQWTIQKPINGHLKTNWLHKWH